MAAGAPLSLLCSVPLRCCVLRKHSPKLHRHALAPDAQRLLLHVPGACVLCPGLLHRRTPCAHTLTPRPHLPTRPQPPQELQELEGLIARKLAPPPPPPTPAIAPQPSEDQQGGALQGGGSSTAASHSTGEQEGVHQDELQQQQQPGEQPGGQQPHLQPEGEEGMRAGGDGVGPLPAEDPALVALDLGLAARQRTWLRYRIQKKQVLHGLL